MRVGFWGSSDVGRALGRGFASRGHDVKLGSRSPKSEALVSWLKEVKGKASTGTFEDAARHGETIVIATRGSAFDEVARLAGPKNFAGKVVIDVQNALEFSGGPNPGLFVGLNDSLAERVQRALPGAKVVKAFNTVPNTQMVDPKFVGGAPEMLIAGNDAAAKKQVVGILKEFGWPGAIDVGGIDHILNGGIPRGNTVLISGSVGTGKTSICIEFLIRGALEGENSLYLSVTEPTDKLLKNVIPFDFFDDRLAKQGKLQFVDMPKIYEELGIDKEDMDFKEARLLASRIASIVEEQKIRRLVLDSVTSVCYRIKDQERIRDFLLRLGTLLSAKGCTSLLVSEIRSTEEGYSRLRVKEAHAGGAIATVNLERRGDLLRTLQVVKMRGTTHSRAKYVLDLTTSGVLLVPVLERR